MTHVTGFHEAKRIGGVEPIRRFSPDLFVDEKKVSFEWKLIIVFQGVLPADHATHHTKWRLVALLKNQVPEAGGHFTPDVRGPGDT